VQTRATILYLTHKCTYVSTRTCTHTHGYTHTHTYMYPHDHLHRHLYLDVLKDCYLFGGCKPRFLDLVLAAVRMELFMPNVSALSFGCCTFSGTPLRVPKCNQNVTCCVITGVPMHVRKCSYYFAFFIHGLRIYQILGVSYGLLRRSIW
jgi:hypothetical protein